MDNEQIKRYADQELFFIALFKFLTTQINRSETVILSLMKNCLMEWTAKNDMSIKEIRYLDEENRLRSINEIIDLFIEKIKHLVESKTQREKLKSNVLLIYSQWKKTHRREGGEDIINEAENIILK